eukprot:CAMPEP_0184431932 /NCGR_PEP_ID=MMETSP0738-20130409/329314_1 /TAXON_ID=385413 /ORGANISM="Thalassiosira miniscula, Strain CCMP1093" /LENGTH=77 /DNA_ID=CAMNT_0026797079 /DNA_START=97 /DNA_END=327 /DNA_ORIENTATION=+
MSHRPRTSGFLSVTPLERATDHWDLRSYQRDIKRQQHGSAGTGYKHAQAAIGQEQRPTERLIKQPTKNNANHQRRDG